MTVTSELRNRAIRCRRLASSGLDAITNERLSALAVEYDARALSIEVELADRTARAAGFPLKG
jgi:hypothetical protein